jgi:predicted short-subunit dehydrogenase-like oxidoreductase (DUF2520 family)
MTSEPGPGRRARVVGRGRAGGSFADALAAAGWQVELVAGRAADHRGDAAGVDLVLLAVPDGAVADIAASIEPGPAVVAHVAGSLGIDVLAPHPRRGAVHPLASLPDRTVGAARLASGITFSVSGDSLVASVVGELGGRVVELPDEARVAYHAAATIASNHLVGLLGQVARVAASAGLPLAAYLPLVSQTLDNVTVLGPAAALTGPAARGDEATLARHRAALDPSELAAYDALAELCRRLAEER